MKQLLSLIFLIALLLTGCSVVQDAPTEKPTDAKAPVQDSHASEIPAAPEGLSIEMERAVYDPSVERLTYFIHNDSEAVVEFGEPYSIQQLKNGHWQDLTSKPNTGWTAIGYGLQPGGVMALTCSFSMYKETPKEGTYRLVKKVGNGTLYAEFKLGESIYTADTPYGFVPLEKLPVPYAAPVLSAPAVMFTHDGVENSDGVEEFLFKSGLGVNCQLRTVQNCGERNVLVIDVIHENSHFLWRMWGDGYVTEKRFSYVVTDGKDLYLSNGANWASTLAYDSDQTFLVPEGRMSYLVPHVEELTADRLAGNITRYQIWSADGAWTAMLTEAPTEFGVGWQKPGEGSKGSLYDLQNRDGPETAITALAWQEDGTPQLTCDTALGEKVLLIFDPEKEAFQ